MSGPSSDRRNGASSILRGSRIICRAVEKYGTVGLVGYPAEFIAAVIALKAACTVFRSLDDNPAEADFTPGGPGDAAPINVG